MGAYSLTQWVLLFFAYGFLGWIWECCFVSLNQGHWVNRGFLQGPLLPIYGFGAILILWATLPVAGNTGLVFFCGMAAASLLEYGTGAAMEKLFRVRYWDYSSKPFNLNGHICLLYSLGWGIFSLLLLRVIHPPVERLALGVSPMAGRVLVLCLTALAAVDLVRSVRSALDLREMLERLTESNEDIRRIQKRLEVYAAFAQEDIQELRERADETRQRLEGLAQRLESCWERLEAEGGLSAGALAEKRAELAEFLERIVRQQRLLLASTRKSYKKSLRILRGNLSAKSKHYEAALEELRRTGGLWKD